MEIERKVHKVAFDIKVEVELVDYRNLTNDELEKLKVEVYRQIKSSYPINETVKELLKVEYDTHIIGLYGKQNKFESRLNSWDKNKE